jgi:hypothetical protein
VLASRPVTLCALSILAWCSVACSPTPPARKPLPLVFEDDFTAVKIHGRSAEPRP